MRFCLPLLLLSSHSVMMNFEDLIKTGICEFSNKKIHAFHSQVMLRNSDQSYFIVYFYVIEQMTCLVIEQMRYRADY